MSLSLSSLCLSACCCCSATKSCSTLCDPWTKAQQASLSFFISWSFSNSSPLSRWCHTTISCSVGPSPPALNFSQHQDLSQWVGSLHQGAKWSFSIRPSHEYSELISFRTDWFELLTVQGTLKSLLLHCNSKVSVLQLSSWWRAQIWRHSKTTVYKPEREPLLRTV